MATQHKLSTLASGLASARAFLAGSRGITAGMAHLSDMDAQTPREDTVEFTPHASLEPVLSMSELAVQVQVSVQTIYDLRSQGRGPRGFRVGRELRFRLSEIDAWLARMEDADAVRHSLGGRL